jgi:hypothetical protein
MSITKREAFHALGQRIRKSHGLSFEEGDLLANVKLEFLSKALDEYSTKYAQAYNGEEYSKGGHPDYNHLSLPENIGYTEEGNIAALFLDLKNFTKYCYFLDKDDVYKAKSAAIEAVIRCMSSNECEQNVS